jgi:MFS family permease
MTTTVSAQAVPWHRTITREQWRVLLAAKFGWMLDAMDFMLYAMALQQIQVYFGFDSATAGMLGTVTLIMSGIGGLTFGYVADRFGRTRALMATIAIFSLASLGAASSQTVAQLLLWRALLGLGMGGEWASGAVLVSETWPAAHRNKAISIMQSGWALGYILAAVLAAVILAQPALGNAGWRWLFAFGACPALLTLWIRRHVREPEAWLGRMRRTVAAAGGMMTTPGGRAEGSPNPFTVIFGRGLIGRTLRIILLGGAVQFGYWGVFFWLPPFLARPVEQGGAGLGIGSLWWIIPVQLGAYLGYLTFGFIADRVGRRTTFVLFMVGAATMVLLYGQMGRHTQLLMVLGPVLGYFGSGYFSMFGSFVAELFPTHVRATGQGTSYNIGRMAGAAAPYTIGRLLQLPGVGIGTALSITSAFFLLAALLVFTLPDRSGQPLEA